MSEISGAELLLLETLGLPYLSYVLNAEQRVVETRLTKGIPLSRPQEEVLLYLLQFLGEIAKSPNENALASQHALGALGQVDASVGMGWSTARRLGLGGSVPSPEFSDDPVMAEIVEIARDLYPLFLLPLDPSLLFLRPFHPPISVPLYQHPQRAVFDNAANADPILHRLFVEDDGSDERTSRLYRSTGFAGGMHLALFADGVLRVAWTVAARHSLSPSFEEFLAAIALVIANIRGALIGSLNTIRAYVGITGIRLPPGRSIRLPWGELREMSEEDMQMIPPGLSGTLQSTLQDGTVVIINYAGDSVMEMDVPYFIHLGNDEPFGTWPIEMVSTSAVEDHLRTIRIALLLSSSREVLPVIAGTWRSYDDPLAIGATGTSWNDPRRLPSILPIALSNDEVDAWEHWIDLVNQADTSRIDVAIRRTLLAITERADPVDGLVDAVIAWENLFGSRSGEPTLRISSSLAWLLSASGPERIEVRREVGRLYGLRSDVVHGNRPLEPSEAVEGRISALRITISALRKVIVDRPELLRECRTGEERSNRLILDS